VDGVTRQDIGLLKEEDEETITYSDVAASKYSLSESLDWKSTASLMAKQNIWTEVEESSQV
jgi:hypothetical protein